MEIVASPSLETRSTLEHWLRRAGLSRGNPFGTNEADHEPLLPECFVDPGVYDTVKNERRTLLVFAPRGAGKTALRVMLASDCRPLQPPSVTPRSQILAVTYSDFDPVLNACHYDLSQLTAGHHIAQTLGEACATLLDTLWQDPALIATLSPPDRSLFAAYCRQYRPALLSAQAVHRHLESTSPELTVSWPTLRQAVTERRLRTWLQEHGLACTAELQLYADLVDDEPEPLLGLASPVTLLSEFAQLVQRLGLQTTYILIDRLDERLLTLRDPDRLAALIAPLVSNLPLMEIPELAFKLFLPLEAQAAVMPFVRPERLKVLEIAWTKERLRELLRLRLQTYSEDKIQSLGKLCEGQLASRIEDEMIEIAEGSPRRLLQLGTALLETQVRLAPRGRTITEVAWSQTPAQVLGKHYVRLLRVDRDRAQVYLGETTPVHLAQKPYLFLVYLCDARGFRTNREISKAVWGDEEWATDELIRQTASRVRKALEKAGGNADHYLVNQPGRGYKLQNTD